MAPAPEEWDTTRPASFIQNPPLFAVLLAQLSESSRPCKLKLPTSHPSAAATASTSTLNEIASYPDVGICSNS